MSIKIPQQTQPAFTIQVSTKLESQAKNSLKLSKEEIEKMNADALQRAKETAEERAKAEYNKAKEQAWRNVDMVLNGVWLNGNKLHYFDPAGREVQIGRMNPITGKPSRETIHTTIESYVKDYSAYDPNASLILNTPVGQMQVFLDLEDDNDKYGVGNLDYVGQLINLDINQDGFLDSSDEFFDKLKLRGYNSNGEEVILKLSDVYNSLDLTKFVNTQKDIKEDQISGTSLFRPEESYKRLNDTQITQFKEMFKNNADESGWIDFTKTKQDEYGQKQYIFKELAKSLNLAYNKVGLNGETRLERIQFGFWESDKDYLSNVRTRFNAMYQDYYNDYFGNKLAIEREFQVITGMKFSEEKFKEFYNGLNNPSTAQKYANALKDVDSVVAMKLNDNGMLTLKFDSGRTLHISLDDLWSSDGEFNMTSKGERASAMSAAQSMQEEDLNSLDFTHIGAEANGSIISLAELGVEFIRKETFFNGRTAFILTTGEGKDFVASTLYKIRSVEDMLKFAELEEKDKLRATKFEREA